MNRAIVAGVSVGDGLDVAVVGALNVSPESFYSGSVVVDADRLLQAGEAMAGAGAAWLDVGAMSTAPYLEARIPEALEADRLHWAVGLLTTKLGLPVSADVSRVGPPRRRPPGSRWPRYARRSSAAWPSRAAPVSLTSASWWTRASASSAAPAWPGPTGTAACWRACRRSAPSAAPSTSGSPASPSSEPWRGSRIQRSGYRGRWRPPRRRCWGAPT